MEVTNYTENDDGSYDIVIDNQYELTVSQKNDTLLIAPDDSAMGPDVPGTDLEIIAQEFGEEHIL